MLLLLLLLLQLELVLVDMALVVVLLLLLLLLHGGRGPVVVPALVLAAEMVLASLVIDRSGRLVTCGARVAELVMVVVVHGGNVVVVAD